MTIKTTLPDFWVYCRKLWSRSETDGLRTNVLPVKMVLIFGTYML